MSVACCIVHDVSDRLDTETQREHEDKGEEPSMADHGDVPGMRCGR